MAVTEGGSSSTSGTGPHSPLVVRDAGRDFEVSCACGYEARAGQFEQANLIAAQHLGPA